MPDSVDAVAEAALQLSPEDREALVERLIASLAPADGLHAEWHAEIVRRVSDADAGRARFVPADEAMVRLANHIHRRRPAA